LFHQKRCGETGNVMISNPFVPVNSISIYIKLRNM